MPSYEADITRDGVNVRVVVGLDDDLIYDDADEIAERVGNVAGRLLGEIHRHRDQCATEKAPF